jgi:hypothetical protein
VDTGGKWKVCIERQNMLQLQQIKIFNESGSNLVALSGFANASGSVGAAYRPELVLNDLPSSIDVRVYHAKSPGEMLSVCISVDNATIITSVSLSNADSLPYFASNTLKYGILTVFDWSGAPYFSAAIDFDLGTKVFPITPGIVAIPASFIPVASDLFLNYSLSSSSATLSVGSYLIRRNSGIHVLSGEITALVAGGDGTKGVNVTALYSLGNSLASQLVRGSTLNSVWRLDYRLVDSQGLILANYSLKITTAFSPTVKDTLRSFGKILISINSSSGLFEAIGLQICDKSVDIQRESSLGKFFGYDLTSAIEDKAGACLRGSFDAVSSDDIVVNTGIGFTAAPGHTDNTKESVLAPQFIFGVSIGSGDGVLTQTTSWTLYGQYSLKSDGESLLCRLLITSK